MSNVVQLFGNKEKPASKPPTDVTGLVLAIADWAEAQGIDIYNNVAFQIRVADLMAQLKIMASEDQRMTA